MRYETRQVRIGEWLGPIEDDFAKFDSASHFPCNPEIKVRAWAKLLELEAAIGRGERWQIYTGAAWDDVVQVGMYDGWPYWKPWPTIESRNWMGLNTRSWADARSARRHPDEATKEAPDAE